jgi:hypothetical protein
MSTEWRATARVSKWLEDPHARVDVDSALDRPSAPPLFFRALGSRCPSTAPSRAPAASSRQKNECRAVAERRPAGQLAIERRGQARGDVHLHLHYHAEPVRASRPRRKKRYKIREYNPNFSSASDTDSDDAGFEAGGCWTDDAWSDDGAYFDGGYGGYGGYDDQVAVRRCRPKRKPKRRGNPLAMLVDSLRDLVDALRVF